MPEGVEKSLAQLRDLGTVSQIESLARQSSTPGRFKSNSHIHLPPNFSAFDSVAHAVNLAADQGVLVLGASNYYDYEVYGDFIELARKRGIYPLFGIEIIALIDHLVREGIKINDPGNPGKIYVCGKGITRFAKMTPNAQRLLATIRGNDAKRMAEMVAKVDAIFARHGVTTGLDADKVVDRIVARHNSPRDRVCLQERHVCQAFQERFFELIPSGQRTARLAEIFGVPAKSSPDDAVSLQNEIRSHLMKSGKPAFVAETFVSFEEAKQLILELGGIPCHPTLADGARPICPFEEPVQALVDRIKGMGMHCAELIPVRNSPEVLSQYVNALRSAGLVVTAGTEHNTLDLIPLEPQCLKGQPVPDDVQGIFHEGACVVAAHQFLTLHGECGFVDSSGAPNSKYPDTEQRIAAFRQLGATIISQYHQAASGARH